MSTKWSCGNSSKDVAPSSLINMIKEHARDQQLLDLIKSFPSSVHEVDLDDKTALMWAIEKGRTDIVVQALKYKANIECEDNDGWTAVMYAARRGNLEVLDSLIVSGANINHASTEEKFTALHLAAGNELMEVCELLIRSGSNPDLMDIDGRTPGLCIKTKTNVEKFQAFILAKGLVAPADNDSVACSPDDSRSRTLSPISNSRNVGSY